jgi:hypothetical protein
LLGEEAMTPAEHAREVAAVRASLLLAPTRAQRHGVYVLRRPPVVVAVMPGRVFVIPTRVTPL